MKVDYQMIETYRILLTPKVEIDPNRVDLLLGSLWLIDYKSHAVGIFGKL
jgi:hypothetical protein